MSVAFPRGTTVTVAQAASYADVSRQTIRRWCVEHGIGVQIGDNGTWRVSAPALSALLSTDRPALDAILAGRFSDPAAQAHMAARFDIGARG